MGGDARAGVIRRFRARRIMREGDSVCVCVCVCVYVFGALSRVV